MTTPANRALADLARSGELAEVPAIERDRLAAAADTSAIAFEAEAASLAPATVKGVA